MNAIFRYPALAAMIIAVFATATGAVSVVGLPAAHGIPVHHAKCNTGVQQVFVGGGIGCPHTGYNVTLTDLTYQNANGISDAILNVYKSGHLVKTLTMAPGQTVYIRGHGAPLRIYMKQTHAGIYSYQRWANMSLYIP